MGTRIQFDIRREIIKFEDLHSKDRLLKLSSFLVDNKQFLR